MLRAQLRDGRVRRQRERDADRAAADRAPAGSSTTTVEGACAIVIERPAASCTVTGKVGVSAPVGSCL